MDIIELEEKDFIKVAQTYERAGKPKKCLDIIMHNLNDMLWSSEFEEINAILLKGPAELSTRIYLALLVMCHVVKDKLPAYDRFLADCKTKAISEGKMEKGMFDNL